MEGTVSVVRGRKLESMSITQLYVLAAARCRVIVDLGTGDGRWLYRLARQHPDWFCVGIDSSAAGMRETSFRARRKPSRGGVENIVFVRAAVEALPDGLGEFADEIHINFPWGSLLHAVVGPDSRVLSGVARLGRPGAVLRVRVNVSALGLPVRSVPEVVDAIVPAYGSAGFARVTVRIEAAEPVASWGKRLGQGRALPVLAIDAVVSPVECGRVQCPQNRKGGSARRTRKS